LALTLLLLSRLKIQDLQYLSASLEAKSLAPKA
jgi:hypothetical protein